MEASQHKTGFYLPEQGTPPKSSAPDGHGQLTEVDQQRKHPAPPHHSPSHLAPLNCSGRFCKEVTPGTGEGGRVLAPSAQQRLLLPPQKKSCQSLLKAKEEKISAGKGDSFSSQKRITGKEGGRLFLTPSPRIGCWFPARKKAGFTVRWKPGIDSRAEKEKMPFLFISVSSFITR